MNDVTHLFLSALPAAFLLVASMTLFRRPGLTRSALVIGLYLASGVALNLTAMAPALDLASGHWNWEGKTASLVVTCVAAAILLRSRSVDARWLGLPDARTLPILAAIGAIYVTQMAMRTYFFGEPTPFDADTLRYQALMPALDEELSYRGLWWALIATTLDRGDAQGRGAQWLAWVVTLILFVCAHAVGYSASTGITYSPMAAVTSGISGALLGWLVLVGRSVWPAVAAHSIGNLVAYALPMIGLLEAGAAG